jgi:iron complex outermembrane receptor protein
MHNKVLARGISLALMSSAAAMAQAQQAEQADDTSQLEEVIVTAQFRTQNLQETPLAITANAIRARFCQGLTTQIVPTTGRGRR